MYIIMQVLTLNGKTKILSQPRINITHSGLSTIFTALAKSTTMSPWSRLIRFVDDNGTETFGEPCIENDHQLADYLTKNDLWAIELKGSSPVGPLTRGDKIHVRALRDILKPSDVPIVRCIGLNYLKHSTSKILCLLRDWH